MSLVDRRTKTTRAWSFDLRAFFYTTRFSLLLAALVASLVWFPQKMQSASEYLFVDAHESMRAELLESEIELVHEERLRKSRVLMLEKLVASERARALRTLDEESVENFAYVHDKLIAADLASMQLYLYENGAIVASVPIASKGKRGSRWQTPTGLYRIQTKETEHFSSIGEVVMPHSMQFFGNFFIHGWPYYPGGEPVSPGFSGGCIRLTNEGAERVFDFASNGTPVFVYDVPEKETLVVHLSDKTPPTAVSARAYLLADVHTGRVYFEKRANEKYPIASISKFMTALVANETIHYGKTLLISKNDGQTEGDFGKVFPGARMSVGDAFYPLLMESNNAVAHALARHYGTSQFVSWMNDKAKAIGADSLSFKDASGISPRNAGTAEDVFRLARYLYRSQSFILNVSAEQERAVTFEDGSAHTFSNRNHFSTDPLFVGGKTGFTSAAGETMVALFDVPITGAGTTTVAAIILGSSDRENDVRKLVDRFTKVAQHDTNVELSQHQETQGASATAAYGASVESLRVIPE